MQAVLKSNGKIVPRRTTRPLKPEELATSNLVEAEKRRVFTECIKNWYGDLMTTPPEPLKEETDYVPYEDDEVEPVQMPTDEDPVDCQGCAIGEQPVFDRLIHAELTLPQGEEMRHAKVLRR